MLRRNVPVIKSVKSVLSQEEIDQSIIFTARRNARIASAVLATAIPSVCLSVTRRYCVKTRHVARCSLHRWIAKCV